MLHLAQRKLELIQEVLQIPDEQDLLELEETLQHAEVRQERLRKYRKPLPKKFDPESVQRARTFKGHDKQAFMRLVREINVKEPVEELLAMLGK